MIFNYSRNNTLTNSWIQKGGKWCLKHCFPFFVQPLISVFLFSNYWFAINSAADIPEKWFPCVFTGMLIYDVFGFLALIRINDTIPHVIIKIPIMFRIRKDPLSNETPTSLKPSPPGYWPIPDDFVLACTDYIN